MRPSPPPAESSRGSGVSGLEGTLTFSHGDVKIKDETVATLLVETLRIVLREQVNGFALTLLGGMLPIIAVQPNAVSFIRATTTERVLDQLPGRVATGHILTDTARQLLKQDSGCAVMGFLSILHVAAGPKMAAMKMRQRMIESQPSLQHRLSWDDLVPTMEALVLPSYTNHIKHCISRIADEMHMVFPKAATQSIWPGEIYDKLCRACRMVSEADAKSSPHFALDSNTAQLFAVIMQEFCGRRCIFVDTRVSHEAMVNVQGVVYISLDERFYAALPLTRRYNVKDEPEGLGRYSNGSVRCTSRHFLHSHINRLKEEHLKDHDVKAIGLIVHCIRHRLHSIFATFLRSVLFDILQGISDNAAQRVSELVDKSDGTVTFLCSLSGLSLEQVQDCLRTGQSSDYMVEVEHYDVHLLSSIFPIVGVGLASRFIDFGQQPIVPGNSSAWSATGANACVWACGENSTGLESLFATVIGMDSVDIVQPIMFKNGVTLSSTLIFGDCHLGGQIYKAALGECYWAGERIETVVAYGDQEDDEDEPGLDDIKKDQVDKVLMPFDAGDSRVELDFVSRFDDEIGQVVLTASVSSPLSSNKTQQVHLSGAVTHYAEAVIAYDADALHRNSSGRNPDFQWFAVRCLCRIPQGLPLDDTLLVYATYGSNKARQIAFLNAMWCGGKVAIFLDANFANARGQAESIGARALII